jgi:hypothetical protein
VLGLRLLPPPQTSTCVACSPALRPSELLRNPGFTGVTGLPVPCQWLRSGLRIECHPLQSNTICCMCELHCCHRIRAQCRHRHALCSSEALQPAVPTFCNRHQSCRATHAASVRAVSPSGIRLSYCTHGHGCSRAKFLPWAGVQTRSHSHPVFNIKLYLAIKTGANQEPNVGPPFSSVATNSTAQCRCGFQIILR